MRGYDGKVQLVGWSDNSRYLASCAGNDVGALGFLRSRPGRHEAHRVERPYRSRRQFRTGSRAASTWSAAGATGAWSLWRPGKAREPIDVQMGDARDQRGALVAGWQTRRGGREEGTPHDLRAGREMKVELRDLHAGRAQGSSSSASRSSRAKRFAPVPKKPRQEVWWPRAPLDGRAFPEGIHPPEGDATFNESARLIGLPQRRLRRRVLHREPVGAEAALPPHRPARRRAVALDQDAAGVQSHLPAGLQRRRVPDHRFEDALLGDRRAARDHREVREALRRRRDPATQLLELRRPDALRRGHRRREVGAGLPA